jgi:NAD(P)-dependent dehydrogenase (short-subunit alcohol dehydrogenase family)
VTAHIDRRRGARVWFVTGASRGLGHAIATAALDAGDDVAVAARTAAPLYEFAAQHGGRVLPLPLDVTDRAGVVAAVGAAVEAFGRLDVVVNNAGALFLGMTEEWTEEEVRAQMEVNFFGALWVSQAVLPHLRAQRSGHLLQMSSLGGLGGYPNTGLYSASKFALEGMSEALAQEAAPFGVHVTLVEPGGYWTDLYTSMRTAAPLPAYAQLRAELERQWADGSVDSDPRLAAEAVMRLVDSDDPPLRLVLGSMAYDLVVRLARQRVETWARWESVSRAAERAIPTPAGSGQAPAPAATAGTLS